MDSNATFGLKGTLEISLVNEHGVEIDNRKVENLVVNTGKAYAVQSLLKTTNTPPAITHMGLGTGAVAAAATDTTLGTEQGTRGAVSTSNVTTTVANDTAQYVATFAAGNGTGAITELGLFTASTAGTMLSRTVFAAVNKAATDSLTITWKIQAT